MYKHIIKHFCKISKETFLNTSQSFCRGSTSIRLLEATLGQQLHQTAKKNPHNEALISSHQNVRLTYSELDTKVDKIAKCLIALNLEPLSKIAIYAPNCEEWTLLQFACARIGHILVNINPAYQTNDLKYSLRKLNVNTLIMPRSLKSSNYLDIMKTIAPDLIETNQNFMNLNLTDLPDLKQIILLDQSSSGEQHNPEEYEKICKDNNLLSWHDFENNIITNKHLNEEEFNRRKNSVNIHHPTNIQFTSGTTGLPKGATLSHYNILNNGLLVGQNCKYTEKDRVLIQVPLFHCFGCVLGNLACITHGSTMIYPSAIFDPVKSLEVMEKENVTSLYGVPTMFLAVLNQQQKTLKKLNHLRTGIMAGSICPKYLMERCINEIGLKDLTICYGMTELSPVTHQTTIYDSMEKKTTSVGTLLPHTVSKIVDEDGNIVHRGVKGEVCSSSYGVMIGYYGDEKATNETIEDGFIKTGDIGYIDNEGFLYIQGRKKDTIIRGGENISPKELEDFIGTNNVVDDVQVIAVKDEKFGDEVCAWIKLKEQYKGKIKKEDIVAFCKNKIAHYKIPRYIRFVDTYPMTVNGKPQKYKMREISNKIIEDKSEQL
jgi:fatty-acyl-CoA synthase